MKNKDVVSALKDGAILGVQWDQIDEMLGLEPKRVLNCALYENTGNFIPTVRAEFTATENELVNILKEADVAWISDDFPPESMLIGRIVARFFSVKEPNRVRWIKNPSKNG